MPFISEKDEEETLNKLSRKYSQMYFGERPLKEKTKRRCPNCRGSGKDFYSHICGYCKGKGYVYW